VSAIAEKMQTLGLRTREGNHVGAQSWARFLRHPIYKGIVEVAGWAPSGASFDPLIDADQFDRVQAVLARRRHRAERHRRAHPDFPLRGQVRCSCGLPLTGSWVRGRSKRYAYYHCPKSHVTTAKAKLEAAYLEKLSELAPASEFLRLFRAVVLDAYQTRQDDARHQVVELDRRLAQLDKRKVRLEEAYLYEQAIDRDTYTRHSDRLSEERALLQLGRHEAELDGLDVETLLNYAEYLALDPARLWQEAGPEQKARLQAFLVPSGLTWDGERFGTVASGLFFSRLAGDSSSGGGMAPQVGFEPTTLRLTAGCSTAELLRNGRGPPPMRRSWQTLSIEAAVQGRQTGLLPEEPVETRCETSGPSRRDRDR
jgi:site-specific DNA recombinase